MHDDVGQAAEFSTWSIDQLGLLRFCRIHGGFDEIDHICSCCSIFMQFKRRNAKLLAFTVLDGI